jgi:hypothetical protein
MYKYYSDGDDDMSNFFIVVSQDGQQEATEEANVVTFDTYLSFGWNNRSNSSNSSRSSFDPRPIVSGPFLDVEANAKYARSLKLDMPSFRNVDLLLDPPMFEGAIIAAVEESPPDTTMTTTPTTNMVTPRDASAKLPIGATILGSTVVALLVLFHLGAFVFLIVWSLTSRSKKKSKRHDDDDDDESDGIDAAEVESILVTPSQTPNSKVPVSASPLGTIGEEDGPTSGEIIATDEDDDTEEERDKTAQV